MLQYVNERPKFNIDLLKGTLQGFGKLPQFERDLIVWVGREYDLDKFGLFLLYFLRIYENGPRGHEYNISEPYFKQSSFKEQCRGAARFITQHYHSEANLYQFCYEWTQFQKRYDITYKKDFLDLFNAAKNAKLRLFHQW